MPVALPQLPDLLALDLLDKTGTKSPAELEKLARTSHDAQTFPTASGDRIGEVELQGIRDAIIETAKLHGFPDRKLSKTAGFDRDCAIVLHRELPITVHTAASRDAWTFITCVLLIDVAVWRFPKRNPERFMGDSSRNTFRRLWMRREILGAPSGDDDPVWDREDVLVQIMERPGVAESRELVKEIVDTYRDAWGSRSGPEREHLMRNFMLRVMRRQGLTRLECVSEGRRKEILRGIARETSEAYETGERAPEQEKPTGPDSSDLNEVGTFGHGPATVRHQVGEPKRDSGSVTDMEDLPLTELVKVVFDASRGMNVGYLPREFDMRLLEHGVRPEKRHRKTVELIVKELRDEGQLVKIKADDGRQVWTSDFNASGAIGPQVDSSISDIRWQAGKLGLNEKEDRPVLAEKLGIVEPMPKYLRRVLNSAISSSAS